MQRTLLNCKVNILDEKAGIVQYVASDQTVDSDREIVRAAGWRFDALPKNAPFVDSHNYSSIEFKLGEIIDWEVKGDTLLESVKWLTDCPEHKLATIGWKMTLAGMPPAVSVGFLPVQVALRSGSRNDWRSACEAVKVDPNRTDAVRISLVQQQKELSAVILGANPNAVARAYKSGIITDRECETFWPDLDQKLFQPTRSYSFPTPEPKPPTEPIMSKTAFVHRLAAITGKTPPALEDLEKERRGQSETALVKAVQEYTRQEFRQRATTAEDYIRKFLADEETSLPCRAWVKKVCGMALSREEAAADIYKVETAQKAVTEASLPGSILIPIPISKAILDLLPIFGAYKTLGVRPMPAGTTKFARVTALPTPVWYQQSQQPDTMVADATLAGASLSGLAGTVGVLIEASGELLMDSGIDLLAVILEKCAAGLAAGYDTAAFAGTGASDGTNGGQTGIFPGASTNVPAAAGNTKVALLQREDFLSLAGTVNPAALQRGCRFWTSPSLLPALMTIKAGASDYLVKTPLETQSDEWSLCGFPLTLTTAAPGTDGAGEQTVAFGHGPGYNVGQRQEIEFLIGQPKFSQNIKSMRALSRGRCDIADATWFAILTTAAA